MKRQQQKRTAVWLITGMLMAGILSPGLPAQAVTGTIPPKTPVTQEKKELPYAEGQALILYENGNAKNSAFDSGSLGSDLIIEETYTFDVNKAADSAKTEKTTRNTAGNICVSLVKSDKYTTEQLVNILNARSDIRIAEPNYKYHILDENYTSFQWALNNIGQNAGTPGIDVNADKINAAASDDEQEKVIALVDTGMDYTHPDLSAVVWNNPLKQSQLKGVHGYDIINGDADPMDDNGHGTHCAGIMAAANDTSGISGIANSSHIKIMPVKILDSEGSCYGMETVGAYNYIYRAQQLGINVVAVNNSWGGGEEEESKIFSELIDLIGKAGALSVCAAGNESSDNDIIDTFPASIDSPYIISVAAINEKGELADFSNYGADSVDIASPGADILSTVSYDTFNPGIYGETKRTELCGTYFDFENLTSDKLVKTDDLTSQISGEGTDDSFPYSVNMKGSATAKLEITENEYFGKETTGKSLRLSIQHASQDENYMLIIPYEATASDTPVYASVTAKMIDTNTPGDGMYATFYGGSLFSLNEGILSEDGSVEEENLNNIGLASAGNCWNHVSGTFSDTISDTGKRVLVLELMAASDGDYTLYIDNLGVSKANADSSSFGKYDYYNGTSMAAPYVTGAVAAIAQAYPEQTALERKGLVLGCSKQTDNLAGKVSSGGMLDFELLDNPRMSVTGIVLNSSKNIEIQGHYLQNAKVSIDGQEVTPAKTEVNCITITGTSLLNKKLHFTITKGTDTYDADCYFPDGKPAADDSPVQGCPMFNTIGELVSDGTTVYQITEDGTVYSMSQTMEEDIPAENSTKTYSWEMCSNTFDKAAFGKEYHTYADCYLHPDSKFVCLNGCIYTVLTLEAGFTKKSILARALSPVASEENWDWIKVADLPETFTGYTNMVLGAYNGKLYLMGGLNEETGTFGTKMWHYDLNGKKWTQDKDLPEGRAFSQALQVQHSMIITLGCRDINGTFPANLIYNGTGWTVSKAEFPNTAANASYMYENQENEYSEFAYYTAHIGMVKDGIIYEGNPADNLGSIYTYQLSKDKYQNSGYILTPATPGNNTYNAVSLQDKFYIMTAGTDADGNEQTNTHSIPVANGCIPTKVTCDDAGYIEQIKDAYLPCDTITLTALAIDDYYINTFTVAGKKISPDKNNRHTFTGSAADYPDGLTVTLKVMPYIMDIFLEEMAIVPAGDTYLLMPVVIPETTGDLPLKWESDNPSVITVDQTGMVTVSDKALPGESAKITVTAIDRGTVSAVCEIIAEEKIQELPDKNSTVPSGRLIYKVTKSAETGGTVSCVGIRKKYRNKLTKISVPGTVNINGYIFNVTKIENNAFKSDKKLKTLTIGSKVSVIGKNVCKSCKKLKKITIKSSRLKLIGKGSFNAIYKKASITVPKKKYKKYKKMLKTAGCNRTVKIK